MKILTKLLRLIVTKKSIILLCLMAVTFSFKISFAQSEYEHGILWVTISDNLKPDGESRTDQNNVNRVFDRYGVYSFKQALPFAKRESLLKIYELRFTGNDTCLINDIRDSIPEMLIKPYRSRVGEVLYNPKDNMWRNPDSVIQRTMWFLHKIKADSAWDITRGDDKIIIAIIDTWFDPTHPDLKTQMLYDHDPLTNVYFDPESAFQWIAWHGTTVAGFASAQTTDSNMTVPPLAHHCSIGYKTKIIGYQGGSSLILLSKALHASDVMHADIISLSMFGGCNPDPTGYEESIVKEILDNGTTIVSAAGNGFCTGCYFNGIQGKLWINCDSVPYDFVHFSPTFPFSPTYDSRIIVVSGTERNDSLSYHVYDSAQAKWLNRTFSYYPEVDICAPGHEMMGLKPTLMYDTIHDTIVVNKFPFYGGNGGTSFSAPIVAGLCGLIKSKNPFLNPAQVQDILQSTTDPIVDAEMYESNGQSQTGTGRINAYKAVMKADSSIGNYNIYDGQDITWTDTMCVRNYIHIYSGGKLTIKSYVGLMKDAIIVVEQGAQLIIDGGHLTAHFRQLWWGIEVWGNPGMSQNPLNQGMISVINNGIIENARIGIRTDNSITLPADGGGIVIGNEAIFKNNVIAVQFEDYRYQNMSSFTKCSFTTTRVLNDSSKFDSFVQLTGVVGVDFRGCSFKNTRLNSECPLEERGIGISSFNSQFSMDWICDTTIAPCPNYRQDTLQGLYYGIRACGAGPTRTCTISHSLFSGNKTGIYLGAIDYAGITENIFKVQPYPEANIYEEVLGGLYLDRCNGYQVEENSFECIFSPGGISVGLVVNNSGTENNIIYNNYFHSLTYGTLAQNQNRDVSGDCGLQIRCNDYTACTFDIAVTSLNSGSEIGIKKDQGSNAQSTTAPAGDTFTEEPTEEEGNYYNESPNNIRYWHHSLTVGPKIIPTNRSASVDTAMNQWGLKYKKDQSCPSNPGSGGSKQEEESRMLVAGQKADSTQNLLSLLVDSGDTQGMISEIETSWPDDAVEIYNQLMEASPYLSDTVMVSTVEKEDVIPSAMVTDILSANPQAAKSDHVMNAVDNRVDQLDEEQLYDINEGLFITGAKESLESKLTFYKSERSQALNNIIRYWLNDTLTFSNVDSIIQILDQENQLWAKYDLAFGYLMNNDTSSTRYTLNEIPTSFDLNFDQVTEYQEYMDLFNLLIQIKHQGKTVMEIDSIQKETLYNILDNSKGRVNAYIRNILQITDTLKYSEPYILPDLENKSSMVRIKPERKKYEKNLFKLYPNPASDYVIIEYQLKGTPRKGQILMYNSEGQLVKTMILNDTHDYLVISLKDLKSGTYFYRLVIDDKSVETKKLSIIH